MASPQDVYNPTPSVQPQTGMPGDTVNVRSNPSQFGGQVAQAVEGLGGTISKAGNEAVDLAIQRQGQINETLANQSEMALTVQGGEIYNKYKTMTGLDAVAARGQAVSDYLGLYNKIRSGLPSDAARRAFDQVAQRGTAYTIRDMNSYAATEQKRAYTTSLTASAEMYMNQLNDPTIAFDDNRAGFAIGNMKIQLLSAFTADEGYAGVTHLDPKTGEVTFDQTPQGQQAAAVWDQYWNKYLGQAYENRVKTMAFDPIKGNIANAVAFLESHKPGTPNGMPANTYAKLGAELNTPYKNLQTRNVADDQFTRDLNGYTTTITGEIPAYDPKTLSGLVKFSGSPTGNAEHINFSPEFGGRLQAMLTEYHRLTGKTVQLNSGSRSAAEQAELIRRGLPAAPVGASPHQKGDAADLNSTDVKDLDRLGLFRKYGLEHLTGTEFHHVQLAPGAPPAKNPLDNNYMTQADYFDKNYGQLLTAARSRFDAEFPDRPDLADMAYSRYESRLNDQIRIGRQSDRADRDDIELAIYGKYTNGQPLTSVDQLSALPEVRDTWFRVQGTSPYTVTAAETLIKSFTRGQASTFGANFWGVFSDVVNGKETDPNHIALNIDNSVDPKDSPLTNTGYKAVAGILRDMQTPEGRAFYKSVFDWLNSKDIHGAVTATGRIPGYYTPDLDKNWNDWLMKVIPRIQTDRAKGVTPAQMLDPKSSEYIGADMPKFNMADLPKHLKRSLTMPIPMVGAPGTPGKPATNTFDPSTIKTPDDLVKNARNMTKEQYNAIATQHGWLSAPVIPTPH